MLASTRSDSFVCRPLKSHRDGDARHQQHQALTQPLLPCAALPTFDIAEGALDKMFALYKAVLPHLGGYITHAGSLDLARLEILLSKVAALEQEVLEERAAVSLFPVRFQPEASLAARACLPGCQNVLGYGARGLSSW